MKLPATALVATCLALWAGPAAAITLFTKAFEEKYVKEHAAEP